MSEPSRHQREANPYPPTSSPPESSPSSQWADWLDLIFLKITGAALAIPQSLNAILNDTDINEFTVGLGSAMVGGRQFRDFVISLIRAWRGT
jgi:hypothetical protein